MSNTPQIRFGNSPVYWCIEKNPKDIVATLLADPSITEGLAITLEENGRQTVSRADACKVVGRLVSLGHADPPMTCCDCSEASAVEADVKVFMQTRQNNQESIAS